ncbi:MAG: hypothetical protein IJ511_06775 [Bacteroides sp.]|nr:hypothetical protein [Bacteroides sp.]
MKRECSHKTNYTDSQPALLVRLFLLLVLTATLSACANEIEERPADTRSETPCDSLPADSTDFQGSIEDWDEGPNGSGSMSIPRN